MTPADVEALRAALADRGVHTLIAQFVDVHGTPKGKYLPLERLGTLLAGGAGFAGPSIWGTALPRTGPRSEYFARGDASAIQVLPWMPGYARVVCSGFVDGAPFDACPRQVLQRATARLADRGWSLRTGLEPEFFLLKRIESGPGLPARWMPFDDLDRLDKPSYDLKSLPRQRGVLHELRGALESMGLHVEQIDHEDAHGQYEVNFGHDEALRSADHLTGFKLAAHEIAERHGAVFSTMPKPFADQPGSGLHAHVSMWAGSGPDATCVFDATDPAEGDLSTIGRQFVAGVLQHAPALCAIAAPTVNSYKRLTVGESLSGTTWAPAFIAHGPNNRTALVRTLPGRFEWRLPDAAANPYLATAALIAAGLDGIERALDPGPALHDDLFEMPAAERRRRGIASLPPDLHAAADALESDPVIGAALGDTLWREFVRLKRAEATEYARHVSPWELDRYAPGG